MNGLKAFYRAVYVRREAVNPIGRKHTVAQNRQSREEGGLAVDNISLEDHARVRRRLPRDKGLKLHRRLRKAGYHPDIIFHSTGHTTVIHWINLIFNKNERQQERTTTREIITNAGTCKKR